MSYTEVLTPKEGGDTTTVVGKWVLICERQARAVMKQAGSRASRAAYNWLRQAMECYEQAAELQPAKRSYTVLRWNTCARILDRNPHLGPLSNDREEQMLE